MAPPFRNLKLKASVAINHTGGGKVERNGATVYYITGSFEKGVGAYKLSQDTITCTEENKRGDVYFISYDEIVDFLVTKRSGSIPGGTDVFTSQCRIFYVFKESKISVKVPAGNQATRAKMFKNVEFCEMVS